MSDELWMVSLRTFNSHEGTIRRGALFRPGWTHVPGTIRDPDGDMRMQPAAPIIWANPSSRATTLIGLKLAEIVAKSGDNSPKVAKERARGKNISDSSPGPLSDRPGPTEGVPENPPG